MTVSQFTIICQQPSSIKIKPKVSCLIRVPAQKNGPAYKTTELTVTKFVFPPPGAAVKAVVAEKKGLDHFRVHEGLERLAPDLLLPVFFAIFLPERVQSV